MTREEAIKEMQKGEKITHHYFSKDEWMTMKRNSIILEDGCSCWSHDFWADRKGSSWEDGYSIFKP